MASEIQSYIHISLLTENSLLAEIDAIRVKVDPK